MNVIPAENPEEISVRRLFRLSVFLKGLNALSEIIAGFLLLVVPLEYITHLTVWLTQDELVEDPTSFVANHIVNFGAQLTAGGTGFGVFYLLSHGIIKLILVIGLLKNKIWAYPASLAVLGLFVVYQIYRYTVTYSMGLIWLTAFDVIVIGLIWWEYRIVLRHIAKKV